MLSILRASKYGFGFLLWRSNRCSPKRVATGIPKAKVFKASELSRWKRRFWNEDWIIKHLISIQSLSICILPFYFLFLPRFQKRFVQDELVEYLDASAATGMKQSHKTSISHWDPRRGLIFDVSWSWHESLCVLWFRGIMDLLLFWVEGSSSC